MKMSLLSAALLLVTGGFAAAQEYPVRQEIARTMRAGTPIEERAVEQITALNEVEKGAAVLYEAGRSVTLQPGFVAQAGSVFEANIARVVSRPTNPEAGVMTVSAAPNPFADQTIVDYALPKAARVSRILTDAQGRVVEQTQEEGIQAAGQYKVNVRAGSLPSGLYIYQIQTDNGSKSIRLIKQ
jgi:hypothetical protein